VSALISLEATHLPRGTVPIHLKQQRRLGWLKGETEGDVTM
jgi:hypothetical protein